MKFIGEGNTAEIYENEEGKILKLFRSGMSKFDVSKEYENSGIVYEELGDLVPKVYGTQEYDKRLGIIYEKVEGEDMLKKMFAKGAKVETYFRQFATYHVLIQRKTNKPLPSVKEKLQADILAVDELSQREKKKIIEYLLALPDGTTLCHFDFHPGNIILHNGKPVVIDWMTACVGTPFADVARTSVLLEYAEIPGTEDVSKSYIEKIKKQMFQYYISEYQKITGVNGRKQCIYIIIMKKR